MLRIVLATGRPKALQAFAAALSSNPEVQLTQVGLRSRGLGSGAPHCPSPGNH